MIGLVKTMFNAQTFAGFPALSPTISLHFTLEVCVTAENRQKSLILLILGVQGRLQSSMLIGPLLKSTLKAVVTVSSKSMSICNRFHAR